MPRRHSNAEENELADERAKRAERLNEKISETETDIEEDEIETGRDFATGSRIYPPARPSRVIQSPDPLAGAKANRDRLSDRYDRKAENLRFAGAKASAGAQKNLDDAYGDLITAQEKIDERERAMIEAGNLLVCICGRDFHRSESSFEGLCGPCERAWLTSNNMKEGTK